jgi:hypothetical protein
MTSPRTAALALLATFALVAGAAFVGCATHLTTISDAKLVNAERFAGFELKDCAADAGQCKAGQIRELAGQTRRWRPS